MATTALKAFVKPQTTSFHFTAQPIARAEKNPSTTTTTTTTPKNTLTLPPQGLLSVKIIAARSLRFASSHSRPYVFAQFDNNEFASREPIAEEDDEIKGVVVPASESSSAARQQQQQQQPPLDINPSDPTKIPSSNGNGLFCLSGQNPIWKQEVDL
jgi:hypothetical protein